MSRTSKNPNSAKNPNSGISRAKSSPASGSPTSKPPDSASGPAKVGSISPAQLLKEAESLRQVLLVASDEFLAGRLVEALSQRLSKHHPAPPDKVSDDSSGTKKLSPETWGVERISPDRNALERLDSLLSNFSLFSSRSLIIFEQIDKLTALQSERLAKLLSTRRDDNLVLLVCDSPLKKGPLSRLVKQSLVVVDVTPPDGNSLRRWVQRELERNSLAISDDLALDDLILIGESKTSAIASLITRASLFLDPDTPLTRETLKQVFPTELQPNEFELIRAIEDGKRGEALVLLRAILEDGKSPLLILSLLNRTFSRYLQIKCQESIGSSPKQMQHRFSGSTWALQKQLQAAKKFRREDLEKFQGLFLRADALLKYRSLGAEEILESLCLSLCQTRPRQ